MGTLPRSGMTPGSRRPLTSSSTVHQQRLQEISMSLTSYSEEQLSGTATW
ncbi:hypothetical protein F2Q70_00040206 [Brassica cretica]|nr:hypothetical protein F2Q70_00040206 [Brassica cretica]